MSYRGMSTLIDNLVINTSDASSKAFGKSGNNGKPIDGFDWWAISCIGDRLQKASRNLTIADSLHQIYNNTDIRVIEFDVNGCGDDGGIEEVRFYDKDDTEIEINVECLTITLAKGYNTEAYGYEYSYHCKYDTKSKAEQVFLDTSVTDPNSFCDYIGKQLPVFNELFHNGKWKIHSVNTNDNKVELYRNANSDMHTNGVYSLPYVNTYAGETSSTSINHPVTIAFPDISVNTWSRLESHCYSQLDGGWEINEGSQNTVHYKLRPNDEDSTKYEIDVAVEQNRNITEVETTESDSTFKATDQKALRKFIQDELKINTYAGSTLDFTRKADRNKIISILDYLDSKGL
tara:strand:- start:25741 stop:26778 length:1038 start_codon:yes stop_codon:yes gene_type:complete